MERTLLIKQNKRILKNVLDNHEGFIKFIVILRRRPEYQIIPTIADVFNNYTESNNCYDWVNNLVTWTHTDEGHEYWSCIQNEFHRELARNEREKNKIGCHSIW